MSLLTMKNVYKRFGSLSVLNGINMTVEAGQVLAIVGPSGSGKSTLLRVINGLESFESGDITVDGISMANKKGLRDIRKHVGMVFQQFNLFSHLTVGGNVMLAQKLALKRSSKEAEVRGRELLAKVGLEQKWDAYPSQLSGGQQQRVAIARALAMDPRIMLFDEATSALDPELVGEVLGVMRSLAETGMTMLVVTHEMNFARDVADRVVFMEEGCILADGSPDDIVLRPQDARIQQFMRRLSER
ncbi:amino acid ABC transporter ATP-binding protein [Raoultella terrigena]|uniref:amino acid ABC transporter ATP-binding protein n=1 Tax=Raoultella terrigena TaxID=577 RepID=UPI001F51C829|nr:amino acid ABC transporter ATP-binding protein [Raoultella terrigena]MCI1031445.1 amino acid ABC transporter ATP-binding protein [Raoultella terrigena]